MESFLKFTDGVAYKYTHIGEFIYNGKRENANSYALVLKQTGNGSLKAGIIDMNGNEVVPCIYYDAAIYCGKYYVQDKVWKEVDVESGNVIDYQVQAKDFNCRSIMSSVIDAEARAKNMDEYRKIHNAVTFDNRLYCSSITINGTTIAIEADTKEELYAKKLEVLRALSSTLSENIKLLSEDAQFDLYDSKTI